MGDLSGHTVHSYELRERIGTGGFGAVYRAYQPLLKREVALKVVLPQYANNPDFIRRFEVEAELVARLEHPHIVPLFDYWRDPDGAYLILRLLRGGSLKEALEQGPLSLERTAILLDQITLALHVAHRNKVVHRDIKPANILLDEDGNAYLTDFGIAKSPDRETVSADAGFAGSLPYVAPEQIRREEITPQTDIYALGIVLYQVLAGEHPFSSTSISQILYDHLQEPLPDIGTVRDDLPAEINDIIQIATAKDPANRYDDVRLVAQYFRAALSLEVPIIQTPSAPQSPAVAMPDATVILEDTSTLRNPYKGLQAFKEVDAEFFFGREALVERLLSRLGQPAAEGRFLAVVGPSGSGKSSVVKAGLVPALRDGALSGSENWFVVEMFPGALPFAELEAALLRVAVDPPASLMEQLQGENGLSRAVKRILPDDGELVLVIDQFEELFTLLEDNAIRTQFLANLISAIEDPRSRLHVIITLRADFYDKPLQYRDFGERLRQQLETVLPMSPEELRQAIVKPASRVGVQFQPGLTEVIIADVSEQPGTLPLLQYALTELFEQREGRMLTRDAYTAIGGVTGALAQRAEDLFQQLDDGAQDTAKQLFLRLVTLGEGTEDARRRVKQFDLPRDAHTDHVIEHYGQHRLLTPDRDPETRGPTVEVAHEALIREWTRLREWIDDSREDLLIHRRLTAAAREWTEADQDTGFLAGGARLAQFEAWVNETDFVLNDEEQAYLNASLVERQTQADLEAARQAHELDLQQRAANRLRYLAVTLAAGLLIALGLSVFAFDRQQDAQNQAERAANNEATAVAERIRADEEARTSRSRELAVQALAGLNDQRWDQAMLLSIEALRTADTYEAENSLLTTLTGNPRLITILYDHNGPVRSVAFDPNGEILASASADQSIVLRDATSGQPTGDPLIGHRGFVNSIAFNPDGTILASASADQTIILWDTRSGDRIGSPLSGHTDEVWSVKFSPDGQILASAGEDGKIFLWDVASGDPIGDPLEGHEDFVFSLAFSPDGTVLASGGADNMIRLWDVMSGDPIGNPLAGHTNWVMSIAFSPDGTLLASGGADNTVRLWDVATRTQIGEPLSVHTDWVRGLAFSPVGQQLVSGGVDNIVALWDVETGSRLDSWNTGHQEGVWSVAFSPDGQRLATGGADGRVMLWEATMQPVLGTSYQDHLGPVSDVIFDPERDVFVSASNDGIVVTATADGATIRDLFQIDVSDVISLGISPNGRMAAFGSIDGSITLWDLTTRRQAGQLMVAQDRLILTLSFSPDGTLLASGDDNGVVIVWDVATGQPVGEPFEGHTAEIQALAFAPGGDILASGAQDNTIILWDVATGQASGDPLTLHEDRVLSLAFSPDGQLLASGDRMGQIVVWEVATHQPLVHLTNTNDDILSLAFNPTSQVLAAAGRNTTITLWNIESGGILGQPLQGHDDWVFSLAFSADGKSLASGARDGSVIVWDLDVESWVERACHIANRNLTPTEWERFIPAEPYQETCSF